MTSVLVVYLFAPGAPCTPRVERLALQDPCSSQMTTRAPDEFQLLWETNYGTITSACVRARAPVWVDRVFNLALNGYYDRNYVFRIIDSPSLSIAQFGTNGRPDLSNVYNYTSPILSPCAVLTPQPDTMPVDVGAAALGNTRGTLVMSTSFNETTHTTWNATAECA